VNVNPAPTVSVVAPPGNLTAGTPITFTMSVQPATGSSAQIRDVDVNFGDGSGVALGAISGTGLNVSHSYTNGGNYTVRVTAEDNLGAVTSAATAIVVLPQAPMSVAISSNRSVSGTDANFTFTATVTPATIVVSNYTWTFGDGSPTIVTSSPQTTHTYTVGSGSKLVTVVATATTGQTATSSVFVTP
jgi:PKD repeat protein